MNNRGLKFALLIGAVAFFIWSAYWIFVSVRVTVQMILDRSFFIEQTAVSWWTALFYATELVPSAGILFRFIASLLVLYSAVIILAKKGYGLSMVKGKVCTAIFLEAAYYLTLIPALLSGFAFAFFGESLWYYGETPKLIVVLLNGVVSIAFLFVIVPVLLKLRAKIADNAPTEELLKYGSITAVSYLFVFWFTYAMSWFSSFVPWSARSQPGMDILMNHLDMLSFAATVFGFLAIALYALKVFLPAIKEQGAPNLRQIALIMTGVGIYFALMLAIYLVIGGYHAHPTVWMEMIMPVHNPDWWCLSFIVIGPYLIALSRKSSRH